MLADPSLRGAFPLRRSLVPDLTTEESPYGHDERAGSRTPHSLGSISRVPTTSSTTSSSFPIRRPNVRTSVTSTPIAVRTWSGATCECEAATSSNRSALTPSGIHTENYALRTGEHPKPLTARTIDRYRKQLKSVGAACDWTHEVSTSDPSYYRWTQWLFVQLFRAGLAVRKDAPALWCASCLTVLAYEQVDGERCERCNTPVTTSRPERLHMHRDTVPVAGMVTQAAPGTPKA